MAARLAIFNHCAMAHGCAMNGLLVCCENLGKGHFSWAIGGCEFPTRSTMCLVNYKKLMVCLGHVSVCSVCYKMKKTGNHCSPCKTSGS